MTRLFEARKGGPCPSALRLQGAEIIFYGDSIFWEYTGENLNGAPTKADLARKAILDKDFANHSYEVAAIPGVAAILLLALSMHGPEHARPLSLRFLALTPLLNHSWSHT